MRKYLSLALIGLSLFVGLAQAQVARYVEGRDYVKLAQAIDGSKAPKVIEFFWYGCPHCYHMSEPAHNWDSGKRPKEITFEMVPAAAGRWVMGAHLFYAAKALGLNIDQVIFDEVHKNNNLAIIFDADKAKAFLVGQGADTEAVNKVWDSFQVKQDIARAEKLFKESGLDGVPSFVVNGQYNVPFDGDYPAFFEKLSDLPTWLK